MTEAVRSSAAAGKRRPFVDLASNAISVFARLLAGVVVFVFMARQMGPVPFGEFMFAMALGALLGFLSTLGFNQLAIREVAAYPSQAEFLIKEITACKATLATIVLISTAIASALFGGNGPLIFLLAATAIFDTTTEYIFCLLRARGSYKAEAVLMAGASVGHFAIILGVLGFSTDPLAVAAAFAASRAIQLVAAFVLYQRMVGNLLNWAPFKRQWRQLRLSWPYAVDVGVNVATSQVDTVLVKVLLGAHAAGVYQAGIRLVVGLQQFSVVAGNVFIPKLAAAAKSDPITVTRVRKQSQMVFGALAISLAGTVWAGGFILVNHGYGAAYEDLNELLPLFAVLIAIRLLAAGFGVQLTAGGFQRYRTLANIGVLATTLCAATVLSKLYGLPGIIYALIASALVLMLLYANRCKHPRPLA